MTALYDGIWLKYTKLIDMIVEIQKARDNITLAKNTTYYECYYSTIQDGDSCRCGRKDRISEAEDKFWKLINNLDVMEKENV